MPDRQSQRQGTTPAESAEKSDWYTAVESKGRARPEATSDSIDGLAGNYLLIRFHCLNCKTHGIVKAVIVNAAHLV
jgi:hypothetical protein